LKNPPILILDEATSAVDNETEAAIQRSLHHITKNRTTIIIAHRLSTIRHADNIFVLEQGELIESGTHEELTEKDGIYNQLWKVQSGEVVVS
jgi:ATP-binding cassette subfamily B protein